MRISFKTFLSLIAAAITAGLIGISGASGASDAVGVVSRLESKIEHNPGGDSDYTVLAPIDALSLKLNNNDILKSHSGSTAEIRMNGGAVISLASDAEMQLGINNVRINKGGAWISYKPEKKDGRISFTVKTPAGTMGIKGTTFAVKVDEKSAQAFLQVREGCVEFKQDDTGKTVDVKDNQLLVIEKGKEIGAPVSVEAGYDILSAPAQTDSGLKFEDYQNANPFDKLRK
ncbi:MAG TPA: FecR family protein [Candidatus Wallbacteria bacterium]|nr:FecR family protein [Candidatus Wallbacteria bacterium]